MKIAIIGYGRMGKQVEKEATLQNDKIVAIIDNEKDWFEKEAQLKSADVAIEFSTPATVVENILKCFQLNIPVVTGTTGWENDFDKIKNECNKRNQTLFAASNFSIGVYLFFKLNGYLAQLINRFPDYEISVEETHHAGKVDKPSGTARQLLNILLTEIERKDEWTFDKLTGQKQISVNSIRSGNVFGIHQVKFFSKQDALEIKHEAFGREGFATGALKAAKWINGKKGVFGMDDMLQF
jgi:4-hydroxy-tetrahydrodipicolinate reductase